MKKIIFRIVTVVLIIAMAATIIVLTVNQQKTVDRQYSWLRSELESTVYHINSYKNGDDLEYMYIVSTLHSALSFSLMIEGDDDMDALSLQLNRAYGNLTRYPDIAKEHLARLNDILWQYTQEGSPGATEAELCSFNNVIDAAISANSKN